jgi:hypothetical protein
LYLKVLIKSERIKMEILDNSTPINTTYYIQSANLEIANADEITYIYAEGNPPQKQQ